MKAALLALAILWPSAAALGATQRLAVVVGNNYAVGEQSALQYAEEDAFKVAQVLRDLGGVESDELFLLRGLGAAELKAALDRVHSKVLARGRDVERSMLIFFFSGHSDGVALELGTDRVRFDELTRLVAGTGAEVRIVIVDSCRSGALLATKGTRPGPAFDVRLVDDPHATGTALLTSSAANEEALEFHELHGSVFTHHLVSGLRGAADVSGDGRVTLAEIYQYAYAHTVTSSAETLMGSQHPGYDYRISGVGDVVLTDVGRSAATLTLPAGFDRALISRRGEVVMEVLSGRLSPLGLSPASYDLKVWRGPRQLQAKLALANGEKRQLAWADLTAEPAAPFATAKGGGQAQGEAELAAARHDIQAFDDRAATAKLRELLARHPPAAIAAKAHLLLGLILFNGSQSAEAREEFKQALLADPAIELPTMDASPKAMLAFSEARRDVQREVDASLNAPTHPAPAPAAAVSPDAATATVAQPAEPHRSHWLSYALGAAGLVAGGLAIYGGVEMANYGSLASQATAKPGIVTAGQLDGTGASFWSAGWIVAAALSATGLGAAVFAW